MDKSVVGRTIKVFDFLEKIFITYQKNKETRMLQLVPSFDEIRSILKEVSLNQKEIDRQMQESLKQQ